MSEYTIKVNGTTYVFAASPETPLLWVLRDILSLTGTKYSCGVGICGACTVHLDGEAVKSCSISINNVAEKSITTIEGLSPTGDHPVQKAWVAENVVQCGYCQPGQIMTAAALLAKNPQPTDDDIDQKMSGIYCRCGTYQRIRKAIHRVANGEV